MKTFEGPSNRSFGLVFAAFFMILATIPLLHGDNLRLWAVYTSLVFAAVALSIPAILLPLNYIWTKLGLLLHSVVTPVVLAILYYGVVTPTALMMRLFGKDLLRLRFDRNVTSYWIERLPPGPEAESLKNQF